MLKTFSKRLKKASRWLPVALLPFAAHAQFAYVPANAVNAAGTYTDLAATGTVITTTSTDDANSAAQAIGFTFTYNGTAFNQFVLSTNGLIKLGATAPSAANLFYCNVSNCTNIDPVSSNDPADVNLLMPFNMDLEASAAGTPEYRVATTGTAPNRVATIQWKNVRDKADAGSAGSTQYGNMQFQVKLYETTNNIEFVYGTFTGTAPDAFRFATVGIKGSGSASGQTVLANKISSSALWSTTMFKTGNYTTSMHNIRGTVPPDTGRTYRFVPGAAPVPAPAVYATLPYSESFEGPWINDKGTRDAPTVNWHNTPVTGDNSWRREDDGFASASWQYQANEMPTTNFPTPPYTTRFSTGAHSARFHSFGSAAGLQGMLDLYVNLSSAGSKTLSFDYINPSGADKLDILLSTDGGATFGTTPLLTVTTSTTFTAKTVSVASTSATSVIRFQATSDFGNDDLGIDNLQLRVITATRNEALAATVALYPNPAHQAFTLIVPAGNSLHAASARLLNALGQVVQTRQLNLPTAGGNTSFDVSSLAAGVYSLELKTGTDLVVKRVVVE